MGQIERGFNRIYGIERTVPALAEVRSRLRAHGGAGSVPGGRVLRLRVRAPERRHRGLPADDVAVTAAGRSALAVAMLALPALLRLVAASAPARVVVARVRRRRLRRRLGARHRRARRRSEPELARSVTTYGPLAGIVALQLWTLLSAIAIFFGAAVAAQLEAVRAGAPRPSAAAGTGAGRASSRAVVRRVVVRPGALRRRRSA